MRRRPGISGLQHGTAARIHYKNLGDHVQQVKLEHMRSQMEIFRKSLEEFALKHRYQFLSNMPNPSLNWELTKHHDRHICKASTASLCKLQ